MTGDNRAEENQPSTPAPSGEIEANLPASVIFMEMMRQAAHAQNPPIEEQIADETLIEEATPEVEIPIEPIPDEEDDFKLEAQRVRRAQKRKARRRKQTVSLMGGIVRSLFIVIVSAALIATILSWFIDPRSLDPELRGSLQMARATNEAMVFAPPTGQPTPNWLRQIGIVSGHYGPENDPGAVCMENGVVTLTENEINFSVAEQVVIRLRSMGYSVDLLDEWDPRLQNYQAAALISIHANTCQDFGEYVSGYLVAKAEARPEGGEDTRLRECIADHYGRASTLERRDGLTRDMTDYHIFREINPLTPGTIIELGFMLADRDVLTRDPDVLAAGIVDGIRCFLEPGSVLPPAEATPPIGS